jgi:hypothetical protein
MNQRNTITIGRVVLCLLGREPVDVGSLEVELTVQGADVPVEKPAMADPVMGHPPGWVPAKDAREFIERVKAGVKNAMWDFPMSRPLDLPPELQRNTDETNQRIVEDVRRSVTSAYVGPVVECKPALVAAAESMEATARAIGALAPEPTPAPETAIPLQPPRPQTTERTSPVLEQFRLQLLAMVPAGAHVDGTANFFGDAVPEWVHSGPSQRHARAHYWLQYLLNEPQYGLQVERVGVKPTVWRVRRVADESGTAELPPLSKLAGATMERIRTMLAADLDALDGTTKAICSRLDFASDTALAGVLRELVLHGLIDFETVSDNAGGEYWRVDLLGGGAA